MAKSDLGTKRICPTTGKKFYDLNKNPVISPYTGEVVPIAPVAPPRTRGVRLTPPLDSVLVSRSSWCHWGRRVESEGTDQGLMGPWPGALAEVSPGIARKPMIN